MIELQLSPGEAADEVDPLTTYSARRDQYHLALGRFIDAFADTEKMLLIAVGVASGAEATVLATLFDKIQVNGALSYLSKFLTARSIAIPVNVDSAIRQLRIITGARNSLVHKGASIELDGRATTINSLFDQGQSTPIDVTSEKLDDMRDDLRAISQMLMLLTASITKEQEGSTFGGNREVFNQMLAPLHDGARTPWQYRPEPSPRPTEHS